jgi:hypothetical protein
LSNGNGNSRRPSGNVVTRSNSDAPAGGISGPGTDASTTQLGSTTTAALSLRAAGEPIAHKVIMTAITAAQRR